jgi:two-component system response regulator FixJ
MPGHDPSPRRVYVVDDDAQVRQELIVEFTNSRFEPIAFSSGSRFLSAVDTLLPGCVLLNLSRGGFDGLHVIHELSTRRPDLPLVLVSRVPELSTMIDGICAGRIGFHSGDAHNGQILQTVGRVIEASGAEPHPMPSRRRRQEVLDLLSRRELEVLRHLLAGHQNRAIGDLMKISPRTVEVHRSRIMQRLGVKSFAELIRLALEVGIGPETS